MPTAENMSWEKLIEEAVALELRRLIEVDAARALKLDLRIEQLHNEMDARRSGKKVGSTG